MKMKDPNRKNENLVLTNRYVNEFDQTKRVNLNIHFIVQCLLKFLRSLYEIKFLINYTKIN